MKKNSKIHFWVETEFKQNLKKQAQEEGLTISDYCRNKLKENSRILKIEKMVEKIIFILEDRKIYKQASSININ